MSTGNLIYYGFPWQAEKTEPKSSSINDEMEDAKESIRALKNQLEKEHEDHRALKERLEEAKRETFEEARAEAKAQTRQAASAMKQRHKRQVEDIKVSAQDDAFMHLFDVADELSRAVSALGASTDEVISREWIEGIEGIKQKLEATIARNGYEKFGREGEVFDALIHRSIAEAETDDHSEGSIAHVSRFGYRNHSSEKIVRPAEVILAKPPIRDEVPKQ